MPGRKRYLNETRQREVCALVNAGCDLEQAALYVGCSTKTIRRESARNPEFFDRLRQAQVASSVAPLQAVRNAAKSHWRAAAWLLERAEPERFVRCLPRTYKRKEIVAYVERILKVVFAELKDPEIAQRIGDGITNILSEDAFEVWAESASYEQLRKAYPRTPQCTRQPERPSCAESASEFGTPSGHKETDSCPISSTPPHVSPTTDNADAPSDGTD